jgi:hypothetical protein
MGQMGFFDLGERYAGLDKFGDPLVLLKKFVSWEIFRPELKAVWRMGDEQRKSNAGRPPLDEVLMFQVLVLQQLYNLSDDQIEYQIRDRLSFMRFLGLGVEDRVVDAKTVWLYREKLAQAGKVKSLFDRFDACLRSNGYLAPLSDCMQSPAGQRWEGRLSMLPSCPCLSSATRARRTRR